VRRKGKLLDVTLERVRHSLQVRLRGLPLELCEARQQDHALHQELRERHHGEQQHDQGDYFRAQLHCPIVLNSGQ
jgi:hypothetical protein